MGINIKVILEDQEREIKVATFKKHRKRFLSRVKEIKDKLQVDEDIGSAEEFLDFQDELATECSEIKEDDVFRQMTENDYESLETDEQGKILLAMQDCMFPFSDKKKP